ncbi:hypothetical protein LIER_13503 [Lithospermum erythrorhizon]|uniref:Uncharacterized protein n=1 Tax=Lithospermum erythrorhizon TaxID=34254 RepID=A0AAV3PVT0_LITER
MAVIDVSNYIIKSNVDTSAINVSDVENVPVASDVQNVPVVVPGGGSGLAGGANLPPFIPAAVVPTVLSSGGGGPGVVPPAFATAATLPPQPPNVPMM